MKKTRVFLGTAALTLAFVGVFAAKHVEKFPQSYYYVSGTGYEVYPGLSICAIGGTGCTGNVGGTEYQLYVYVSPDYYSQKEDE
jgi:hypothetical protein